MAFSSAVPAAERLPVTVLTGYLGAGKTTLLNRILTHEHGLKVAVIVNEFGEVGIDNQLVVDADEEIFEMNNGCICCTVRGDLIRIIGNLMKRRDRFDHLVIETTGLADPGPVTDAFRTDDFLRERYVLAGVVVVVSATTPWSVLAALPQALSQVRHADLVVLTKVDRADPLPMQLALSAALPRAPVALSAQASLEWTQVQALLKSREGIAAAPGDTAKAPVRAPSTGVPHGGRDHHHHGAQSRFVSCPTGLDRDGLTHWASGQRAAGLQRLKGVLQSADGRLFMAQWALGDEAVSLVGFEGPAPRLGLTCIA
jgi:G3E family GTPase